VLRPTLRAGLAGAVVLVIAAPAGSLLAQETPPTTVPGGPPATTLAPAGAPSSTGREWLVAIPAGCEVPDLPDVVFVGTLLETGTPAGAPQDVEYETARFRVDQARAGDVGRFTANGLIDVRYGLDAKDLDAGARYLVGASVDPAVGVLVSRVRLPEPFFGGDDVIAASERDVTCPVVPEPVRTTHVDGTPVDASVAGPLLSSRGRLLRAILLPLVVAVAIVFVLAAIRWLITGVGKGVGSFVRTAAEPREVRAAMRTRPNAQSGQDSLRH
jgi:hypothetical protein